MLDPYRSPLSRDATGEPYPDWEAETLPDLLLQAAPGRGDQFVGRLVEEEHDGGIDLEQVTYSIQQLGEKLLQAEMGKRDVGDCFDALQPDIVRRPTSLAAHHQSVATPGAMPMQ